MKKLRHILLLTCMITVLTVAAEQPDPVISSIQTAYQKAKELTRQTFGTEDIELQEGSMWCSPIGGVVDTDDSEMQAAYEIAKEQGVLPPQLLEQMYDFGMQMNRFFIAAQQQ